KCSRASRRTASRCSERTSAAPSPSPRTATVQGSEVITIERFIMEQERLHPEATGELSNLLYDLCLAAKIISRHVRRAGLSDILGPAGAVNVSGDLQQKLDLFANETVRQSVQYTGRVCVTASEEDQAPVPVPPGKPLGKYVVLYDPLDGSANIDVNVSIGTIFSIHKRVTKRNGTAGLADCLQVGKKQIAAGYILYGSSTMLVYTTGQRGHLSVSRRDQLSAGQAAPAVRSRAAGARGGAGGGPGDGRLSLHPRPRARGPASEDAARDRQPGRRRVRGARDRGRGRGGGEASDPKPVYGPEDWTGDPARQLSDAGAFPFTRGVHPTMYRGKLWTMRQYAGFGTAEETNARFRHLLAAGQTGLSVAFDLPTQMGYDSDHPMAEGEVGRAGVA